MTGAGQEPRPEEAGEMSLDGFRRARGGMVTARFGTAQAGIIRNLVTQVADLVGGERPDDQPPGDTPPGDESLDDELLSDQPIRDEDDLSALLGLSDNAALPADPVLARLLPDAYSDDPEAAAEFRRYTEVTLRSGKVAAARAVLSTLPAGGGRVRLDEPAAQAWLRALNDVRLALGVVLEVTDDDYDQLEELSADDPRTAYVAVYQWLAYLQESLVDALD